MTSVIDATGISPVAVGDAGVSGGTPAPVSRLDALCQCHHPRYEHRVAEPYTTTRPGCRRCHCGKEML